MRMLVTGGFGNVGRSLLDELIKRGHNVRVLQRPSKKNLKIAKKYGNQIEMYWGDVTDPSDAEKSLTNCDVIIHLASAVPPTCEKNKENTFKINVEGTMNFIRSIEHSKHSIAFLFASSMSVMGPTQDQEPPIDPYQTPNPTTYYTHSKIEIENYLKSSKLNYCICRIGGVIVTKGQYSQSMLEQVFNFPLNNRLETVLDLDCAIAFSNAAELLVKGRLVTRKILNIGGGKDLGHFIYCRDLTQKMFCLMGIGALNERCYSNVDYFMDWSDTQESQKLLNFQKHTFPESMETLGRPYRKIRPFLRIFSPLIRRRIEKMSPYK